MSAAMSTLPERIEVEQGRTVVITWEDGVVTRLTARDLRAACECATCREPSGVAATKAVLDGETAITIEDASLVGGYAVTFAFAPDGHRTGIYPFARLREEVPGSG
jgi:DUF971 family protein